MADIDVRIRQHYVIKVFQTLISLRALENRFNADRGENVTNFIFLHELFWATLQDDVYLRVNERVKKCCVI